MMQRGDILLKKGSNIGAYLIRELTADGEPVSQSYSHSGFYAGDNKVWDATFPAGVALRDLDYGDFDVYRLNCIADEQVEKLFAYCEANKGKRYAVEELIKQGVDYIFHIPLNIHFGTNGVECSWFVNDACQHIGIPLTNKPLPTPNDLGWSVAVSKVDK